MQLSPKRINFDKNSDETISIVDSSFVSGNATTIATVTVSSNVIDDDQTEDIHQPINSGEDRTKFDELVS